MQRKNMLELKKLMHDIDEKYYQETEITEMKKLKCLIKCNEKP